MEGDVVQPELAEAVGRVVFEQMLLGAIRDEVSVRNSEADSLAMILAMQNSEAQAEALKAAIEEATAGAKGNGNA